MNNILKPSNEYKNEQYLETLKEKKMNNILTP